MATTVAVHKNHRRSLTWNDLPGPAVIIAALVILAIQFAPTLRLYFMADDFSWLYFLRSHLSPFGIVASPSPGGWTTPVANVAFWTLFKLFGWQPIGYWVTILLLHVFNTLIVFLLVHEITLDRAISVMTSIIFMLHFVHFSDWGPLVWISAIVQPLVASIYLSCVLLFIWHLKRGSGVTYVLALVLFAAALLCKETALSLPFLLAVCNLGVPSARSRPNVACSLLLLLPFVAVWVVYLVHEFAFQSEGVYLQSGRYGIGMHVVTNWAYFSNLIAPNPTSAPVESFLLRTFPRWTLVLAQVSLRAIQCGMLIGGVLLWSKGGQSIRIWLTWMFITYLPFIGFAGGWAGPNRYFYLPAIGFSALLAYAVIGLWRHVRVWPWSGAHQLAVSGALGLLLVGYNLLPTSIWQRQMSTNSVVRHKVVTLVGQALAQGKIPAGDICLQGFPTKFGDLSMAIKAFYDRHAYLSEGPSVCPSSAAMVIRFDNGQITVIQ